MIYRVLKSYGRGPGTEIGKFNDLASARVEIQKKLADDLRLSIKGVVYSIYEGFDLLEQFDESNLEKANQSSESSDSSTAGGQQRSQSFRPSPLNTSPRPPGTPPPNWTRDDEDKKEE